MHTANKQPLPIRRCTPVCLAGVWRRYLSTALMNILECRQSACCSQGHTMTPCYKCLLQHEELYLQMRAQ